MLKDFAWEWLKTVVSFVGVVGGYSLMLIAAAAAGFGYLVLLPFYLSGFITSSAGWSAAIVGGWILIHGFLWLTGLEAWDEVQERRKQKPVKPKRKPLNHSFDHPHSGLVDRDYPCRDCQSLREGH